MGLYFAGGDVHILYLVVDGVAVFEAHEADFEVAGGGGLFAEVIDQIENVGIDVVGVAGVQDHVAVSGDGIEGLFEDGAVEKADLVGEFDAEDFPADVMFLEAAQGVAEVAAEDEGDADGEADEDADEEVGEDDGDDGGDEREELVMAFGPHLAEEGRVGEFEAGGEEDGAEGGEGDFVEPVGDEEDE